VKLCGPKESPFEDGIWKVHVTLPPSYPYKSPSIGFCNKIYHPNIDEASGSVCLDVINQTWSPMFDLVNVFSVFLPQLLLYPNPTDPLNGEAAALLLQNPKAYNQRVQEYVKKYASKAVNLESTDTETTPSKKVSESSLSDPVPVPSQSKEKKEKKEKEKMDKEMTDSFEKEEELNEQEEQLSDMDDDGGTGTGFATDPNEVGEWVS